MAIGVAFTGIEHSSNIKFSELRREFKTIQKRSTYSGEDDHSGDSNTISISASELLRNTSGSPNVPDAVENASIPTTQSNWKTSQFTGSVKFYYLNQTGTNDNTGDSTIAGLDLDNPTNSVGESSTDIKNWFNNINKNVNKVAFIDGTIGSLTTNKAALEVDAAVKNLSVKFGSTSRIYGAGGYGGGTPSNAPAEGTPGGHAVDFQQASGNIEVYTDSQSLIYAGGGGGGKGGAGGVGGGAGCIYNNWYDAASKICRGHYSCSGQDGFGNPITVRSQGNPPAPGAGGPGRGYNYTTGSLAGTVVTGSNTGNPSIGGPGVANATGGASGDAGDGGDGGEWGENGEDGVDGAPGTAGQNGGNYSQSPCAHPSASAAQTNALPAGAGLAGAAKGSSGTGIIGDRSVWSWTSGSNTSGIKGGYTGAGP